MTHRQREEPYVLPLYEVILHYNKDDSCLLDLIFPLIDGVFLLNALIN